MSEDFLDELGEEFRAGYNPPPATPREAIWGALQARRSLRAAYNPPPPTPVERIWAALEARRGGEVAGAGARAAGEAATRPWPARRWVGWALPIAATLLVGISIGRFVPFAGSPPPTGDASVEAPEAPGPGEPAANRAPDRQPSGPQVADAEASGRDAGAAQEVPGEEVRGTPAPVRTAAGPGEPAAEASLRGLAEPGGERPARRPAPGTGTLYRVAALETLGGAEALLGSVGAGDPADAREAAAIADWGEDMLSQTRLLMDSPAAEDPAMRALLEDLELVLAQLVRLGEGTTAEGDLELIEGAVREQQLLYRIRALLPAGRVTAGT
jgi:hypothetical protein